MARRVARAVTRKSLHRESGVAAMKCIVKYNDVCAFTGDSRGGVSITKTKIKFTCLLYPQSLDSGSRMSKKDVSVCLVSGRTHCCMRLIIIGLNLVYLTQIISQFCGEAKTC